MVPEAFYGSNLRSKQHLLPECCHRSFTLRSVHGGVSAAASPTMLPSAPRRFGSILPCQSRVDRQIAPAASLWAQQGDRDETAVDQRGPGGPVDSPER